MAEIDSRVRQIRRIGVGVFLSMAALSVPLGIHIHKSWRSPELGLTLLGAVLLLVLISLFALETAVTRIPAPRYTETDDQEPDDQEPDDQEPEKMPPDAEDDGGMDMAEQATELDLSQQTTENPDGPVLVVPNLSIGNLETRLSNTELYGDENEDQDEDEDEDEPA